MCLVFSFLFKPLPLHKLSCALCRTFNVPVPGLFKQLVTRIQLLQFFTMISQAGYLLAFNCPYPQRITTAYFFYIITLIVLFLDFSKKTYSKSGAKDAKTPSKKKTN